MSLHLDDHVPVPITNAVVMTAAQFNDLQAFLADLVNKSQQQPAKTLDDGQFAALQKMLAPGAELSALMLADYKTQHAASTGPTTRSLMAEGAPEAEWRTPEEIANGVPFNAADRNEIIADRNPQPAPIEIPPATPVPPVVSPSVPQQ